MKVNSKVIIGVMAIGSVVGGLAWATPIFNLALPVLAGKSIPVERLVQIGFELGSDVPFFLHGGTQLGFGRGGELYPQADVHPTPILLVTPDIHVATGPAYAALGRGLTFTGSSSSINNFQAFVRALDEGRDVVAASALSANDFETVVFKQHPQLRKIAKRLRTLSPGVRMSGSGSTIFFSSIAFMLTISRVPAISARIALNMSPGTVVTTSIEMLGRTPAANNLRAGGRP